MNSHFSLLVATNNRVHLVERLFESLVHQTYKDFSVVFVFEEDCADSAFALANRYSEKFSIVPVNIAKSGISRARNLGFSYLSGEYVAFPDDDCVYLPDTLELISKCFLNEPHVGCVLARRANLHMLPSLSSQPLTKMNRFSAFAKTETFLQFYKKEAVDQVGFFDEEFGGGAGTPYGCGEDTDYVLRALDKGITVLFYPPAIVQHPQEDFVAVSKSGRVAAYACGRMYLLRKHRLPFWFRMANVFYPLFMLPIDIVKHGKPVISYRWKMFCSRLKFF